MTTKKQPELAEYASKPVPQRMLDFAAWITEVTGEKVDPRAVYLGSALREKFQKAQREAGTVFKPTVAPKTEKLARTATPTRKPSGATAGKKPQAATKSQRAGQPVGLRAKRATTDPTQTTVDGVVVAESRHVEA